MGTRSVTYFHDGGRDAPVLCAIYCQFDGYPSGMGDDIKAVLGNKSLVNGYTLGATNVVNGVGCAAAMLVSQMKDGVGGVYMARADAEGEDYNYHIYFDGDVMTPGKDARLSFEVFAWDKSIYNGRIEDFDGATVEGDDE